MLSVVTNPEAVCQYPDCGRPVAARTGARGRPRAFCDNPEHTASRAYELRRKLHKKAQAKPDPEPATRPVTAGVEALATLLGDMAEIQARFAATVTDAGELLADITDPRTIAYEVSRARHDADIRIAEAATALVAAERDAAIAESERARARQAQELAEAAADEAIAERDQALADRDNAVEIAARHTREADRRLEEIAEKLAAANDRAARAEAERDAANARADHTAAEIERIRASHEHASVEHLARVEQLHAEHRAELADIRHAADAAAHEIRQHHAAQTTALADELAEVRRELADAHRALAAAERPPTGRPRRHPVKGSLDEQ